MKKLFAFIFGPSRKSYSDIVKPLSKIQKDLNARMQHLDDEDVRISEQIHQLNVQRHALGNEATKANRMFNKLADLLGE